MRPEDVAVAPADPTPASRQPAEIPLDASLLALDAELAAAGRQAARSWQSRTQPTRWFSLELRRRLLEELAATSP